MRITITIDDGLGADLKRCARAEGKPVSAVVAEALRAQLGKREPPKIAPFRPSPSRGVGYDPTSIGQS